MPGIMSLFGVKSLCMQPSLAKFWKKEFWESVFLEQHFFNCSFSVFEAIIVQMKNYLLSEPEKLTEILGKSFIKLANILAKVPSSGSSNLFLSREIESVNRALMVRRLTTVVLCADTEILKMSIPNIQEKIVDILKIGVGISSAEVVQHFGVFLTI